MAGVSEAVIEEVKSRVDLVDLIASYGIHLKSAGASKKACCPFHHEKTPSFAVNEARGYYHCFGCGESGDAIKFVSKMEGLSFVEAVKKLAERFGIKIDDNHSLGNKKNQRLYALMAELAEFYHRCLIKTKEAELARAYLDKRNLNDEVRESFMIGYAPKGIATILKWAAKYGYTEAELSEAGIIKPPQGAGDSGYHRFGGRLMFTIRDKQGRVVAFSGRQLIASKNSGKYVNSPETSIFKKSKILFGLDKAAGNIARSEHREAIVCEGQIDTIRLHISGFPIAVASQGTAFTNDHVQSLKRVADQVALVFDDDAAGHKATIRTASLFLAAEMPVRVVSLPNGDDPDSYLCKHTKDEFQTLLDKAESIMSFQVRVERAKEKMPDSTDAVMRIAKAILTTIASAESAVIRASMIKEASIMLNLPVAALNEELEKLNLKAVRPISFEREAKSDEAHNNSSIVSGEEASQAIPPSKRELALCALLLANEYNKEMDALLGELLPPSIIGHEFTRRFIEVWRNETINGADLMQVFVDRLSPSEQKWFNKISQTRNSTEISNLTASEMLKDIIYNLWDDALDRLQRSLPASGGEEVEIRKLQLAVEKKRFSEIRGEELKGHIRRLIAEQVVDFQDKKA